MTTHSKLYVGSNTHLVEVSDLQDNDGTVQTNASVEMTALIDKRTGAIVTGVSLPLVLSHIANGLYRATLPHTIGVAAGHVYLATIIAIGAQGFRAEWQESLIAQIRRA